MRLRKKRNAEEGIFVNLQTKECLNDKINFLVLYSQGEWEKHLEWLSANSLKSIEADWYLRKVSSDTEFCKIDIQWRLLIPFRLIRSADLKRDIIIVGVGNRIEVWDSENWGKVYKWLETQSVNMEKGVYKP
ncbi:MAG: hypothetical protein HY762_01090 [Planctomycetes bacterium]|nr:hypothetical protein [Planctomycetota bacterium]